jgi:hypothetical protein
MLRGQQELLAWTLERDQRPFFERLLRADVWPLDPCWEQGVLRPTAELLRRDLARRPPNEHAEAADDFVRAQANGLYLAKELRALPHYAAKLDPALRPFFRPHEAYELIYRARNYRFADRIPWPQTGRFQRRAMRMRRPGLYYPFVLPQLERLPALEAWRLTYADVHTAAEAVDYVLNQLELARVFRRRDQSPYRVARRLLQQRGEELLSTAERASGSTSWPDKFHVSVSLDEQMDLPNNAVGPLKLHLFTDRAFRVPGTNAVWEREVGLPWLINPREIVGFSLRGDSPDHGRRPDPTTHSLCWSADYAHVDVVGPDEQLVGHADFDASTSRYRIKSR